jgi:alkanesulfonate monooxygenase SsuD/methylene tetrahydromethanopterin reductase-like flavin-dependent oxidoreductase (luciferase family)
VVCVNLIAAESTAEARFLLSTVQQQFLRLYRGDAGELPAPVEELTGWAPHELMAMEKTLSRSLVGDKAAIRHGIQALLAETQADELMFNGPIFDHQARLRSFALGAEIMRSL